MHRKHLICAVFLIIPRLVSAQEQQAYPGDPSLDSLLSMTIMTASKHHEAASDAPASVSVITSQDFERFGFKSLDDVIASVRSFYASYDRNYAYIGVRGFSRPTDYNDRILLLLNGHTLNEAFYGSSPFGSDFAIDLDAIDRIEIVRGPGSVLYGSGAMFAVVNAITRTGNAFEHLRASGGVGSSGASRGTLLAGKNLSDDAEALISAFWQDSRGRDLYYREYDADTTNHGIARGLDWDRSLGLFTSLRVGEITLQGMFTSRKKGIPTGAYAMAFNDSRAFTLDQFGLVDVRLNSPVARDKQMMVRAYYDYYHYEGSYPYEILSGDATRSSRVGGECQLQWDLLPNNRLIAGAEYVNALRADLRNWDADTTYFNQDLPYNIFSLYLQDDYQVNDWISLTLGVRRDSYSTFGSTLTPRGGVVLHASASTTFKLLFGQAFRAPNMYEISYRDDYTNFKASSNLRPEKITTIECVIEQRIAGELFGVVSLFGTRMRGLIDQVIDPADSMLQFQNMQDVNAEGIEGELTGRWTNGVGGYLSYTFQRSRERTTGIALTNVPSHMLKAGISWTPLDFLRIGAQAEFQSGRKTVQRTSTAPFAVANIHCVLSPPPAWAPEGGLLAGVRLSLLVRNLFNTPFSTPGGFEHRQDAIAQDGRSYLFVLGITL